VSFALFVWYFFFAPSCKSFARNRTVRKMTVSFQKKKKSYKNSCLFKKKKKKKGEEK
jgi:hypothetical protein